MDRSPRWRFQLSPGWAWHTGNLETTVWPNQEAWNCLRGQVDGSNLRLGPEGCRVQAAHAQSQWPNPWLSVAPAEGAVQASHPLSGVKEERLGPKAGQPHLSGIREVQEASPIL